jgi:hypothetical protein
MRGQGVKSRRTPQWRVEDPTERVSTNAAAIRFTVAPGVLVQW